MKYDWNYVTEERARMNVALISAGVIKMFAIAGKTEEIVGVCALMNAIMESLEEKEAGEDQ